jgi:hypothetical protein
MRFANAPLTKPAIPGQLRLDDLRRPPREELDRFDEEPLPPPLLDPRLRLLL